MNKFWKRGMAILLSVAIAVATISCSKNEGQEEKKEETTSEVKVGGSLTIGQTSLTGDFSKYWQRSVGDQNVFDLLQGYACVTTDQDGAYVVDKTVVKDYKEKVNEDGTKTFTITINDGLVFCDGSKITAENYVAMMLYNSSKAFADMGAENTSGDYCVGYEEYSTGKTKIFKGIRLLDEYTFSITVSKDKIPYFYELKYMTAYPISLEAWAPGFEVKDDGEGAYFSKDLTKKSIEKYCNKERYTPSITAGPYKFVSYDENSKIAVIEINDLYAGNWEGQKPHIQKLIFKETTPETMVDELKTGSIDLLNGIQNAEKINTGLDLVDTGKYDSTSYDDSGYGQLVLSCDFGPTQFVKVRQAINYVFDKAEFMKQRAGGYGTLAYGYYGTGQWMYQDTEEELKASLNDYAYNIEKAKELLIEDGWTLNKQGKEFKEGTDEVRYKKVDGKLMPLTIKVCGTTDSPSFDLMIQMMKESCPKVGIDFQPSQVEWALELDYFYRVEDPEYHAFYMAISFTPGEWDPSYDFSIDQKLIDMGLNGNYLVDEELYNLALEMRKTDSNDVDGYLKKYVAFQKKVNELSPNIPLYASTTYDFFSTKLKNYKVYSMSGISYALLYANVEE